MVGFSELEMCLLRAQFLVQDPASVFLAGIAPVKILHQCFLEGRMGEVSSSSGVLSLGRGTQEFESHGSFQIAHSMQDYQEGICTKIPLCRL